MNRFPTWLILMKHLTIVCAVSLGLVACKSSANKPEQTPVQANFFPVTYYLEQEWKQLDSLELTPLHVATKDGRSDSNWINTSTLKALLQPFLQIRIDATSVLNSQFTESSFNDETIQAITFSYDPRPNLPDSQQLRRWDVYVAPETGKLKQVYLIRRFQQDGQTYIQQMTWKCEQWAKITLLREQAEGNLLLQEDKFHWDL